MRCQLSSLREEKKEQRNLGQQKHYRGTAKVILPKARYRKRDGLGCWKAFPTRRRRDLLFVPSTCMMSNTWISCDIPHLKCKRGLKYLRISKYLRSSMDGKVSSFFVEDSIVLRYNCIYRGILPRAANWHAP